jgi:hypothetical protein
MRTIKSPPRWPMRLAAAASVTLCAALTVDLLAPGFLTLPRVTGGQTTATLPD